MSPQNPPFIVGLAAPGLLWLATSVALAQDPPTAPPGPQTPAPTSSPKTYRVLLLSSGKVVQGEIVEDADAGVYRLRGTVGTVPYPKTMVLKAAGTVEELYQFQAARLPAGDSDERMKLARWCLAQRLTGQAREQLLAIKEMSPGDVEVERMLYNLASMAPRPAVDPAVRQTSGEMPRVEAPAALDPRVIRNAQKRFNALPEIFDLPPAQAVKRANEFADFVQPVLQASCVRCHSEKYQGEFQLVQIKLRRDLTNSDIARANLDATLRLINPDDPARSELLSAGLVPHGGSKNAIFRGANDRSYQVLATWAKSLRPARAGNNGDRLAGDSRTGFPSPDNAEGDGFAADRSGYTPVPSSSYQGPAPRGGYPPVPTGDITDGDGSPPMPMPTPKVMVERYDEAAEFVKSAGDNPQFPAPFAAGGAPPPRATSPAPRRPQAGLPALPGKANAPEAMPPTPAVVPKTATQVGPNEVVVGPTDNPNELPGMNQPRYPPRAKAEAEPEAEADPARKPVKKIDNALLEKMMRNRNGNATP